jgi:hypothetical protein
MIPIDPRICFAQPFIGIDQIHCLFYEFIDSTIRA